MPSVRKNYLLAWGAIPGSPLSSEAHLCPPGAKIVTVHFNATTGGTYQLMYVDHTGAEVELTTPVVVLANQLVRAVFNGNVPQFFASFTPSAINGRAKIEVSVSSG